MAVDKSEISQAWDSLLFQDVPSRAFEVFRRAIDEGVVDSRSPHDRHRDLFDDVGLLAEHWLPATRLVLEMVDSGLEGWVASRAWCNAVGYTLRPSYSSDRHDRLVYGALSDMLTWQSLERWRGLSARELLASAVSNTPLSELADRLRYGMQLRWYAQQDRDPVEHPLFRDCWESLLGQRRAVINIVEALGDSLLELPPLSVAGCEQHVVDGLGLPGAAAEMAVRSLRRLCTGERRGIDSAERDGSAGGGARLLTIGAVLDTVTASVGG